MKERVVADLSRLPRYAGGSASLTWWGTLAFILIEGTGFALGIAVYLYLFSLASTWPIGAPPPDLLPGTILTAILLLSLAPNYLIARWAEEEDLTRVRIGIVAMTLFGVASLVPRIYEFGALRTLWDSNAYGSITWTLLGLHTLHIVTDLADTVVLGVLMFTRYGAARRRFGDVQDNAMYWNFVVVAWVFLYLCIYWIPRL